MKIDFSIYIFTIVLLFLTVFTSCQKKIIQSKSIRQNLSGDYLIQSDTLKYQLSLKKIDENTYYYQFYDYSFNPDSEGFTIEFSGILKKSGVNYRTIYTNSLDYGFILSLEDQNEIYVKKEEIKNNIDQDTSPNSIDAVSELKKIGIESAIELLNGTEKEEYFKRIRMGQNIEILNGKYKYFKKEIYKESFLYDLNTNPQIIKGNYKKLSNISASAIILYKYPCETKGNNYRIPLSKGDEIRVYDTRYSYPISANKPNISLVGINHDNKWYSGWISNATFKDFEYVVRYLDGEKHEYEHSNSYNE